MYFKSKHDEILTGHSYRAYGKEISSQDSEYADDTALIFNSRRDTEEGITQSIVHFARFEMEVHSGQVEPRGYSKSVVLFCPKPPSMYNDLNTYDNLDLSDITILPLKSIDSYLYKRQLQWADISYECHGHVYLEK